MDLESIRGGPEVHSGQKGGQGCNQTVAQSNLAVCAFGEPLVVGHQGDGEAMAFPQIEKQIVQGVGVGRVQVPRGLVRKEQGWVVDQCAGHSHPLLLPATELARQVLGPGCQPQFFQLWPWRRLSASASERPPTKAGSMAFSRALNSGSSW